MNVLANLGLLAAESGPFEAPNKWLPENSELLWGTIAFIIVAVLLWKLAGKPIKAAMQGRTDRIGNEIATAAKAKADADAEVARVRQNLADVEQERARILAEAVDAADRIRIEGVARNDIEVTELETRAEADIEALRARAGTELQAQVATWVGEATNRIVTSQLDDATLERLVEDFIAKVGASS
jgi:F-type H+-transporting ATPase subunit b